VTQTTQQRKKLNASVSLWSIYRFAYHVAVRSVSRSTIKDALRLILEPCNYWRNVEVPAVLSHLDVRAGERVLDIGSPKLPSLFIWHRLGAEVWATDLFPYFFKEYSHYKERLQNNTSSQTYHIEAQDARKLTYTDAYFDKVFSISVLEHIEDNGDSLAMREIARVLKPGGLCCLTVPAGLDYSEETIAEEIYYKKPMDGKPIFYQRHYDWEALRKRLVDPSGLQPTRVIWYGERWVHYEKLYAGLPRFLKVPLAAGGPVCSRLFLHPIGTGCEEAPRAAVVVLRKIPGFVAGST
jgi:ubiquinone/menaquinone biosynthesis C-methylase UbiE